MRRNDRHPEPAWGIIILFLLPLPAAFAGSADDAIRRELRLERFAIQELDLPAGAVPASLEVAVEREGVPRVLKLERHAVRGPAFRVLVQRADGALVRVPDPPPRTYRGTVEREAESVVAASLLPSGLSATVLEPRGSWCVRPAAAIDPASPPGLHVIYAAADAAPFACGGGEAALPARIGLSDRPPRDGIRRKAGCTVKVADIAFDSDYEFFADKGGASTDTCVAIIEDGLNATNAIYERDVKITHRISAIIIRSDPEADFYARFPDASDFDAMLVAFRGEWNANMGHIERDLAYLLTGKPRPEYGGLAYIRTVCTSYHYGMGIGGVGYEGIFRHEIGHNWGCGHSCGSEREYIMCGNAIGAISAHNIGVIAAFRDTLSCLEEIPYDADPAPPYVRLDPIAMVGGEGPMVVDVLAGDTDIDCDDLRLASFDGTSSFGASIEYVDPGAGEGGGALLYTPRTDLLGTDFFRYVVSDGTGFEGEGIVLVRVAPRALIAWLKLDETAGTEASDASGSGHDGELRRGLSFDADSVEGRYGRALKLEGVGGEYVSLGDDPDFDLARGITVAAWFTARASGAAGETLAGKGDSAWRLTRGGGGRTLRFSCGGLAVPGGAGGTLEGRIAIDDGRWHHAAGVYDGRRISLYVDGVLDRSLPAWGAIRRNTDSVHIGEGWRGSIDDVRLYNHGLSEEEIRALHEGARVENCDPPDGATGLVPGSMLRWLPAPSAAEHDIYLGTDPAAVASAAPDSPEHVIRQRATTYLPDLEPGTTYFWRIDEIAAGDARKGAVRSFTTAFASTDFDEPRPGAASYAPGAGGAELGFRTDWARTNGASPYVGVIETSTTPTTPIFTHRSARATTTFDAVDLSERDEVAVRLILQARDTRYEEEDGLQVYVTNGTERIPLLELGGGAELTQRAGIGYETFAASVPDDWEEASLVLSSTSNSSGARERYDFDQVAFARARRFSVVASTRFREPAVGATSYTPGEGDGELGFATAWRASGGADPYVGVREVGPGPTARILTHRSAVATTTFDPVDLRDWDAVRATAILRIASTGYESGDALEIYATNGAERVDLVAVRGDTGLEDLADDAYASYGAAMPPEWEAARLVFSTSSDSSAGRERFDLRGVEFAGLPAARPPAPRFRRGDANADGAIDIADAVRTLNYLFAEGSPPPCLEAADANDDEALDIGDPIAILAHLFAEAGPLPPPFAACGTDPAGEGLPCARHPPCE